MPDKPITHQINERALQIVLSSPDGARWVDLNRQLESEFPDFHPKTINGCTWKLVERYSDQIHKPEKGLFKPL